jgi:deoxyadenosine/deoxycytidine kinase
VTIIKIHGCSGAGKTTAVRQLMDKCEDKQVIYNLSGKVEAYKLLPLKFDPIYVLGSYENNCGGMDTVGSAKQVMNLLDRYAKIGHVVFEGLLQSTYYGEMGTHSLPWGQSYVYAFLDTPIEKCLERVEARRAEQGSKNKFNPQLTRDKHTTIQRLQKRVFGMGHRVVTLAHDSDLVEQLLRVM